jgi:hypothetical protein
MMDLLTIMTFFAMILSPCLVAMSTGIATGAELGVRDPSEPGFADSDYLYIPG